MERDDVQQTRSTVREKLLSSIEIHQDRITEVNISDNKEGIVMYIIGVLRSAQTDDGIKLYTQADIESTVEAVLGYRSEEIVYEVLSNCIRPQKYINDIVEHRHAQKVLIRHIQKGVILPTYDTDEKVGQILINLRKDLYAEIIRTATSAQTNLTLEGDWTEIVDAVVKLYDYHNIEFLPDQYTGFSLSNKSK